MPAIAAVLFAIAAVLAASAYFTWAWKLERADPDQPFPKLADDNLVLIGGLALLLLLIGRR